MKTRLALLRAAAIAAAPLARHLYALACAAGYIAAVLYISGAHK